MAGEETVGGIQGFLRLDADQFHREILRALAEIKELDGQSVDVRVKTDSVDRVARSTRSAASGMDEMGAASRRLNDATDRVRVAQLKLDEVQGRSNATASQHLSAMNAVKKALRDEQDAVFATYDGNIRLGHSNDLVAKSARQVTRDVDRMGGSFNKGGMGSAPMIVGAIGAGMALLGPVTGAATAAVGGLVGVLGTAALAYVGFNDEVKKGTALGQYLQGQLTGIKGEFLDLGHTAAGAMSGDVIGALSEVRRFLPTIDPEVEALAGHLGRAFHTGTGGLITGLQVMMPLLQDGGRYAEVLANKFAAFTASDDFKDFVDYARRELPNVGSAIVSLAGGIKDLGVALAPVGDDLIELIHVSGQAASAIAPVVSVVSKVAHVAAIGANPLQFLAHGLQQSRDAANEATPAIDEHTSHLLTLQSIQSPLATALGTTDAALNSAREAHQKNADAAANATAQMQYEGDAAGLLKQALDALNGKALNLASTQNSFDSALANSNKHIAANGKTIDRATTSLAGNSAAAVANRGELIRQVKAAEDVATAMRDNGASTDETRAKMVTMRDQILKNADAHGLDKKAVEAFIDQIYKIPKKIPPTRLEVETKQALTGIAAFQKAINALHGKAVTASVHYAYTGRLPNGGFSQHGGSTFGAATGGLVGDVMRGIKGYDGGGLITGPGSGTSDSILAAISGTQQMIRVSNREFVSTEASQQRNRAALEAGNRGATLAVVDGSGRVVELGPTTIAAIAAAVSRVKVQTNVSASQFDQAMMAGVRA